MFFHKLFSHKKKTTTNWRISTAADRIVRLKKIQNWIKEHQKDLHLALLSDFRKPPIETDLSEIFAVTSEINHAIKHLKFWMKPNSVPTPIPLIGPSVKIYY